MDTINLTVIEHAKRPQWGAGTHRRPGSSPRRETGRGVVIEELPDRLRFFFENGGERTFLRDDPSVRVVEMPEDERVAIHRSVLRRYAPPKAAPGVRSPDALERRSL